MKNLLVFSGMVMLFLACATKPINFDQLQDRNGLFYLVNDDQPYTGDIISYHAGKVEFEGTMKNGLKEGLWIYYYPTGQKKMEGYYQDGLKEGTWSYWEENGEPGSAEIYKMGNRLGNEETIGSTEQETSSGSEPKGSVNKQGSSESKPVNATKADTPKPKPVVWERLRGGPVKFLDGRPYSGPVVKYFKNGQIELEGTFLNGHRNGKWTFYFPNGTVKDIRYY